MILWEHRNGANGRYFFILRDEKGEIVHISKVAKQTRGDTYELTDSEGDLLMATFRNWALDLRRFSLDDTQKGAWMPLDALQEWEFSLTEEEKRAIKRLEEFKKMIEAIKSVTNRRNFSLSFGNQRGLQTAYENLTAFKLKVKLIPERRKLLLQIKKKIYQLWVLTKFIDALQPNHVSTVLLSRRYKGKQLDHPKHLYDRYEDRYGEPPAKLPGLFGRKERLTLGRPTVQLKREATLSIWQEFQTPTPEPKTPRLRPDFVVKRGAHETLFDAKILEHIREYELEGQELSPNFFDCLKPIDLVIECKTFTWHWEKVRKQIDNYQQLLHPNHFLIVARDALPKKDRERLKQRNISLIDNLTPAKQEDFAGCLQELDF